MPRSLALYLSDIEKASADLVSFTQGKVFSEFSNNGMMQAAVERKFEIIGEALVQMKDHHPAEFESLPETRPFIAFRNILIQRYSGIDDRLVWEAIQSENLAKLRATIAARLQHLEAN